MSFKIRVVSSANCVIFTSKLFMISPLICLFLFIDIDRLSTAIINIKADNGHPCLIPHFNLKYGSKVGHTNGLS